MNTCWINDPCKPINKEALEAAQARQNSLTKPQGSLGELEKIAVKFCGWQDCLAPQCDSILIRVFAADHGICRQGVSAFPQEVTAQMVANFVAGGAAISVLAKQLNANFMAVNLGTVAPCADAKDLINEQICAGTADFTEKAAMSEDQMATALNIGRKQFDNTEPDLFIAGDMGIGNTTSASAIYSALLNQPANLCVGPGTGVDAKGMVHKAQVIEQARMLHKSSLETPLEVLRCLGGLEIAAMAGSYIAAAQNGCPVLIDGFISTAAALIAVEINPACRNWMIFAHKSAEPAHILALNHLNALPLLDLGLRLGEGSGAALTVSLIKSALALHNQMATFENSGVSDHA